MPTKTTGADWKAYMSDDSSEWWPSGSYMDDELVISDGVENADPDNVSDEALVIIKEGAYFNSPSDHDPISLEAHFKRWRKAQATTRLVVEIGKAKVEDLKAVIKANGGKVIGS